ncbi:hypothetical protein [Nonlabens antarcticus]|uniref:hypothetical protein n=1 Tax=Nonlabens antarcticus TaxID=392714 RepID=UPI001891BB25|nr:hypothetical protein [Nonlabens antarcticus]
MRKLIFLVLSAMLIFGLYSCDDNLQEETEIIDIDEPMDDLVRLESIVISNTPNGAPVTSIDITYDINQLITSIAFTGTSESNFQFTYAANNRLTQIDKIEGSQITIATLAYENNTITITTTKPDQSREFKELHIDSQNRIDRAITYDKNASGTPMLKKRLKYTYTENFNVSRIDELASDGSTILKFTEFTYFLNNNPFRDMNDVIRFLVFEDFIPYTRYLPLTRIDYERVGSAFLENRSINYNYTLQDDDFPNSREVETTTATGTGTSYEFFNYQ